MNVHWVGQYKLYYAKSFIVNFSVEFSTPPPEYLSNISDVWCDSDIPTQWGLSCEYIILIEANFYLGAKIFIVLIFYSHPHGLSCVYFTLGRQVIENIGFQVKLWDIEKKLDWTCLTVSTTSDSLGHSLNGKS